MSDEKEDEEQFQRLGWKTLEVLRISAASVTPLGWRSHVAVLGTYSYLQPECG
jgi:hypothetical protein